MFLFGVVAVGIGIAILLLRLYLQLSSSPVSGAVAGAIVAALLILITNAIYMNVASRVTKWENHRTQRSDDNAKVRKFFWFQFLNVFIAIYYLAFAKARFDFFGLSIGGHAMRDACYVQSEAERRAAGNVIGWGCVSEVNIQLGVLMLFSTLVRQLAELVIPYVQYAVKRILLVRASKDEDDGGSAHGDAASVPEWERQAKLKQFPGVFNEYNQLVLQFAMVTMFAAVFPLAPALALLNNFFEIRTDAIKLVRTHTKPRYKPVKVS